MIKEKTPKGPFAKRKQRKIDKENLSEQMYKRNLELAESNQALSLLRTIDKLVLESHDELEVLCQNIAKAVIDHSTYPFVAILANPSHKDYIELFGWASSYDNHPEINRYRVELAVHDKWLGGSDRLATIDLETLSNESVAHILNDSVDGVIALRRAVPVKSVIFVKLLARNRLAGLMVVGFSQEANAIAEKEHTLLDRLSEAVGIALDNKLLYEENQSVLRQMKKTNEKLKLLDEAKDEFVGMASHQLRTPLTSMKGYVSMVLDGDAGKITAPQKKLLEQAFISSQRMVYLIADLLNVSRLKTGKFIIEPVPTDLAKLLDEEVGQLSETAKGRKLSLTYDQHKNFPLLMLDETKTRQVLMNFIDNAIYYTPPGGHIHVHLEEKGEAIECRVEDDGLGVPKTEQHLLFSKFFRAGNAKKARPDGTGLGLFMAKKVIAAQGGAIIFSSTEGKGSVFGFSFAKAKLKVPTAVPSPK